MKDYTDFIDITLSDLSGDPSMSEDLEKFKQKRKAQMRDRETSLRKRGLSDSKVIRDLIISENVDCRHDFIKEQRKALEDRIEKRLFRLKILLSISYYIFVGILFLLDTFYNHDFEHSWIIIAGGIVLYADFLLVMPEHLHYRGRRRLSLSTDVSIAVLITAFFLWLIMDIVFKMHNSELIITSTLLVLTIFDSFVPLLAHEKYGIWHTIATPPGIGTWLYLTLGLMHVIHWQTGWMLIVAGIAVSIIIFVIHYNRSNRLMERAEALRLEKLDNTEVHING